MRIQKVINALTTFKHRYYLKIRGASIGNRSRFCGKIKFRIANYQNLKIGNNVIISGGYNINTLGVTRGCQIQIDENASLTVGNYCGLSDCSIWAQSGVEIGNYVTIGAGVIINDSNNHCLDYIERRAERGNRNRAGLNIVRKKIKIEDDVFIGAMSYIGKGVTIGARSIIAAGSVVVSNVPPDEVWGGNPAKRIK